MVKGITLTILFFFETDFNYGFIVKKIWGVLSKYIKQYNKLKILDIIKVQHIILKYQQNKMISVV